MLLLLSTILLTGCLNLKPQLTSSATILIKTPKMKFYDKGFIFKYSDYTQVQIFSTGIVVLDLKIYEDRICKSVFECQDLATFNSENLDKSYPDSFLKDLFDKNEKEVIYRDKKNRILIRIRRD